MGAAGERIGEMVRDLNPTLKQSPFESMDEAVQLGRTFLERGGVVLLSPGAPSFDRYKNWEERSDDFTRAVQQRTA
jgi:UDP-N-acetylmuramoylalanine--D-glutamate ligase